MIVYYPLTLSLTLTLSIFSSYPTHKILYSIIMIMITEYMFFHERVVYQSISTMVDYAITLGIIYHDPKHNIP